ncbi:adenosylcobalamin-dependent ribonucleoside-diphosphate reductase [Sphingosinicella microcystinivorans]|uniref:adenosylcobalamin-dependent ribonucleoside-diphosphate reductase n=1 Tax=Sphingosinicella microcystinivorans TaxID=335406 RepID=UPI0022F3A94F|nr:adenosylcobalamin-dependent ribonucleoside-diphosphate reductase [Sphingosinicella microcystinivorans]WBX83743.1 adenosylcobalamin-dependent ribonucleoside-diphosphate reductase [Sphingosinicella microcystinivorans]
MFDTALAEEIWTQKYRFQPADGDGDESVQATWVRVAHAIAANDPPPEQARRAQDYLDALTDFRFIPAGRILAGAGTGRNVTLFNCFVMGAIPDDLDGIFMHLREAALTMQQGGGVGMDFSSIRPSGAAVRGVGAQASGPLSFMDSWNAMCGTIAAAGQRRGAMMGCLRIDHPDIEAFIDAKRDQMRLRNFNLSVLVDDAFMKALACDGDWPLVFGGVVHRTVGARDLWRRLMQATYDVAEPGVIFIDRVNQQNNLAYCEEILASNPCGEQMLPAYGACLLGSINLARLVPQPFAGNAALDEEELAALAATAVRFLDNVIDISRYPLPQQEAEARSKRRIGLGVTGLADALLFCNAAYGSGRAIELTRHWLGCIKQAAYRASALLAAEKGPFPLYDPAILDRPNLRSLDDETRVLIAEHGLRNGCLTSIAPTGTTSLLAGNVSSGIEPVFAYSYTRKVRQADGSAREEAVEDHGYRVWKQVNGDEPPPADLFVSAQSLEPSDHLAMQAPAQAFIDSSISKTVNCPEDISFEAFMDVYAEAYHLGCKGLTTYRPNATTGSVLSVPPPPVQVAAPAETHELQPRPESLHGTTYKIKWPDSAHAVYVTINDTGTDKARRPVEMFINSKNMEHYAWTLGLTRMISAVLRRGGDIAFVAEELKAVFDPRGGAWMGGRYVPSLLAAIGGIFERHLETLGDPEGSEPDPVAVAPAQQQAAIPRICPQCSAAAIQRLEGCDKCLECGYSKCG